VPTWKLSKAHVQQQLLQLGEGGPCVRKEGGGGSRWELGVQWVPTSCLQASLSYPITQGRHKREANGCLGLW
jgi:hypothetical protein